MKNTQEFSTINAEQLMEINGGGFAYDVGRFLRFVALGGTTVSPGNAYADWVANEAVNDYVNG